MVKIDNLNNPSQTETSGSQTSGFETKANPDNNQTQKSGLLTIIGNLLPLAPMAFKQFTGQKVPQVTGTIAEMQMALISIQNGLQTIVNNQNQLVNRIQQLESSATNHLTNLTHQFKSLRLTHTKEQKQIEYGNNPSLEESTEN